MSKKETKGGELFRRVEQEQGYAFISDGIDEISDERVFNIARAALKHTENTARIIRAFLRRYHQL